MKTSDYQDYFREREKYSNENIEKIRIKLSEKFGTEDFCVVADGSYARKEASPESDIDFYIVGNFEPEEHSEILNSVNECIKTVVHNMPSVAGPFAAVCSPSDISSNIGGDNDSNSDFTRRILLLLEGDWLFNQALFGQIRKSLIDTYVMKGISEKQLALFLLNDVIRYYRTVCVDFNYKTIESSKPWGIRNIKLVFSRKFLYFCGVLAVAETANMTAQEKRDRLVYLLDMPPIQRFQEVCGTQFSKTLQIYCEFLKEISDPATRDDLKKVPNDRDKHTEKFRHLKNLSFRFSHQLMRDLRQTYDVSHPIHNMLIV